MPAGAKQGIRRAYFFEIARACPTRICATDGMKPAPNLP
jgi:hypothetical protein